MMKQNFFHGLVTRMKSLRSDVSWKTSTIKRSTPCENPAGYAEHLNNLYKLYKHVGNAPLIPTYLFCMNLFLVGWVKPPAAYPATSLENLTPWWSKTFLTVMGLEWNHSAPMYPRKPPRSRGGLHAKIQQDMLNILIFFYKHVGNALLIPTYFFLWRLSP